jgi:hypothetical protein
VTLKLRLKGHPKRVSVQVAFKPAGGAAVTRTLAAKIR